MYILTGGAEPGVLGAPLCMGDSAQSAGEIDAQGALDTETRATLIPIRQALISTTTTAKATTSTSTTMAEDARETTPLLRTEEVDKMEVYPIIHAIRADIMASEFPDPQHAFLT